jgi:hypothetical protein
MNYVLRNRFILLCLIFVLSSPGFASAPGLPEVEGFTAGELKTTPLEAPAGEYGEWLTRVYRDGRGRTVKATLMAGPGAGSLRTPPEGTRSDDRPIGFGSIYEGLTVGGRPALLEEVPSLGLALAVDLGEDTTLTLESSSLNRQELLAMAAAMISPSSPPDAK